MTDIVSARTMHMIGDTHFFAEGSEPAEGFNLNADVLAADLTDNSIPIPEYGRWHLGDLTNDSEAPQEAVALPWLEALTGDVYAIHGNHDCFGRTAWDWATVMGYDEPRYAVDLGLFRVLVLCYGDQDGGGSGATIYQETRNWLEAELESDTRPHYVLAHRPLNNTVLGTVGEDFRSIDTAMYSAPISTLTPILTNHANLLGWFSGHNHIRLTAPDYLKAHDVNGRELLSIAATAPAYTCRTGGPWRTFGCESFFLQFSTTGAPESLIIRDHTNEVDIPVELPEVDPSLALTIPDDYFDGDSHPLATWEGTPHASISRKPR